MIAIVLISSEIPSLTTPSLEMKITLSLPNQNASFLYSFLTIQMFYLFCNINNSISIKEDFQRSSDAFLTKNSRLREAIS